MSQRPSGYKRKERDRYETPEWVTAALMPHVPPTMRVWEPAAGSGKMVRALEGATHTVIASDIEEGPERDFFRLLVGNIDAIITNPPYELAQSFIQHAMGLMHPNGLVAMLLRTDFDHAKTRLHLFTSKAFAKKLVLVKRIKWFEDSTGQPSFNHAWFIWDWKHQGLPVLAYGP